MAFTKITDEERLGKGNVGQPDTPLLTTTQMQEQMDSLANLAIDGFNRHIDEIGGNYGAQNIGMPSPGGVTAQNNVFSIINAMAVLLKAVNDVKHSHLNKTVLDDITADTFTGLEQVVTLLANITSVQNVLESSSTAIPTSYAVSHFLEGYDYRDIIKTAIYPIGSIYATTSMTPDQIFGTSNEWTLVETTDSGIKIYRRTS